MNRVAIVGIAAFFACSAHAQVTGKDLEAVACHGAERQLRELSELTTGILDGWGKENSAESSRLMEQVEARHEIAKRMYAQFFCADRPPLEARELYLYALSASSKSAGTSLSRYLEKHGRKRVRSVDFDQLCAIMTRQAKVDGIDGTKLSATIGGYCTEVSRLVPTNDVP